MNQMKLSDAFWAYTAMNFICLWTALKNKLLGGLNRKIRFIWVQWVHLFGQFIPSLRFPMNQMNLDVVICCLWTKVYSYINVIREAMNPRLPFLQQGSLIGG